VIKKIKKRSRQGRIDQEKEKMIRTENSIIEENI